MHYANRTVLLCDDPPAHTEQHLRGGAALKQVDSVDGSSGIHGSAVDQSTRTPVLPPARAPALTPYCLLLRTYPPLLELNASCMLFAQSYGITSTQVLTISQAPAWWVRGCLADGRRCNGMRLAQCAAGTVHCSSQACCVMFTLACKPGWSSPDWTWEGGEGHGSGAQGAFRLIALSCPLQGQEPYCSVFDTGASYQLPRSAKK
jgi:hypothetical protein